MEKFKKINSLIEISIDDGVDLIMDLDEYASKNLECRIEDEVSKYWIDKESIKMMLLKKDISSLKDFYYFSPLHVACYVDEIDQKVIQYLIDNKSNLNLFNMYEQSPLHVSCNSKNISMNTIRLLIESKSDLDDSIITPLHFACNNPNVTLEIVKFLVDCKSDTKIMGLSDSPLRNCVENDNLKPEIIKYLIEIKNDLNLKDCLIYNALKNKNIPLEVIKLLIENKADLRNRENFSDQSIILAVNQNFSVEILKYLLENKANPNTKAPNSLTPLQLHFYQRIINFETIKLLVEFKSDLNYKNLEGNTSLHMISERNDKITTNLFKLFLEHKANLDIKNNDGWYPFCYLVKSPVMEEKLLYALSYGSPVPEIKQSLPHHISKILEDYKSGNLWNFSRNKYFPLYLQKNIEVIILTLKIYNKNRKFLFPKLLILYIIRLYTFSYYFHQIEETNQRKRKNIN